MGNKGYEFVVNYSHEKYGSGETRVYCTFLEDDEYDLLVAATKLELDLIDLVECRSLNSLVKERGFSFNNKYVKALLNTKMKLHDIINLYSAVFEDIISYLDAYSRDNKPEKYLMIAYENGYIYALYDREEILNILEEQDVLCLVEDDIDSLDIDELRKLVYKYVDPYDIDEYIDELYSPFSDIYDVDIHLDNEKNL